MTEELAKLRTKFVEKVSKEIVDQLLDNLLDENVLNDLEKDALVEKNKSTADRARDLVDRVKKKGERASNMFILHLQNRDPILFEDLCQVCGLAANAAAQKKLKCLKFAENPASLEQRDGPSTLKSSDIYPVTANSVRNRVALLITNITFGDTLRDRIGAEKDEENMENLLSSLDYEVVKHRNLTAKEMNDALAGFSKHPKLKETDSVFVVIMSHGVQGAVLGVGELNELPIDSIYTHLDAAHCPELVDKPKVIIIQACRGDQRGTVFVSSDAPSVHSQSDLLRFIHREKDFIALLSSTPGTVSYREKSRGSFLIQFIRKVFDEHARQDDIEELFRKVMRCFEEDEAIPRHFKQMATKDRCTLTRRFYPGLHHQL